MEYVSRKTEFCTSKMVKYSKKFHQCENRLDDLATY
jgi:hypothetical protein